MIAVPDVSIAQVWALEPQGELAVSAEVELI
jgi:hypothetical protein